MGADAVDRSSGERRGSLEVRPRSALGRDAAPGRRHPHHREGIGRRRPPGAIGAGTAEGRSAHADRSTQDGGVQGAGARSQGDGRAPGQCPGAGAGPHQGPLPSTAPHRAGQGGRRSGPRDPQSTGRDQAEAGRDGALQGDFSQRLGGDSDLPGRGPASRPGRPLAPLGVAQIGVDPDRHGPG